MASCTHIEAQPESLSIILYGRTDFNVLVLARTFFSRLYATSRVMWMRLIVVVHDVRGCLIASTQPPQSLPCAAVDLFLFYSFAPELTYFSLLYVYLRDLRV